MNGIGSTLSVCNGPMEEKTSDQLKNHERNNDDVDYDIVPDRLYAAATKVFQCTTCGKIYWEGGHLKRIRQNLDDKLVAEVAAPTYRFMLELVLRQKVKIPWKGGHNQMDSNSALERMMARF